MKRDIITINDLSNAEILEIFALADRYLAKMADPDRPHRVAGRLDVARNHVLATLFYEPSTRTRLSFESAMARLGGASVGAADPATTSAVKGESIADTVRVVENYADLIVLRHPSEGAARAAAEHIAIPVINGGDGSHEHPTQTLCDLYTLRRENKTLQGLNVLLAGDLKHGRTVHSLVYALARFGANIVPMPAKGLELPPTVTRRLEEEYNCTPVRKEEVEAAGSDSPHVDVVYVTNTGPHQLTLLPKVDLPLETLTDDRRLGALRQKALRRIDIVYMTRKQGERIASGEGASAYPVIDPAFLKGPQYSNTRVLHPLPRVDELSIELDADPRGVYFKQAAYGVPVRMALMAKVLGIEPFAKEAPEYMAGVPVYASDAGLECANANCITRHPRDRRHIARRFWVLMRGTPALRCQYCETDTVPQAYGDAGRKRYATDLARLSPADLAGRVLFASREEAEASGFHEGKPGKDERAYG